MEKELSPNEIINLLNVYLNEYTFRVKLLWSQSFKLFYASLIVIILPNIPDIISIDLYLPILMFRLVGLFMSFVFLYIAICYAKKVEASTETYRHIIEKLPTEFQRIPLEQRKGKYFKVRTSYAVILLMFSALITIDIIMLTFG